MLHRYACHARLSHSSALPKGHRRGGGGGGGTDWETRYSTERVRHSTRLKSTRSTGKTLATWPRVCVSRPSDFSSLSSNSRRTRVRTEFTLEIEMCEHLGCGILSWAPDTSTTLDRTDRDFRKIPRETSPARRFSTWSNEGWRMKSTRWGRGGGYFWKTRLQCVYENK